MIRIFSLPTLSVHIMKCLFEGQPWNAAGKACRNSRRKEKASANSSSEYFLINVDKRVPMGRPGLLSGAFGVLTAGVAGDILSCRKAPGVPWRGAMALFILLLLFLLPRSSIDDIPLLVVMAQKITSYWPDPDPRSGLIILYAGRQSLILSLRARRVSCTEK